MEGKTFLISKSKKIHTPLKGDFNFQCGMEKKNKNTGPDKYYGLAEPLALEERISKDLMIEKNNNLFKI